ncbi:TIGR02444 family protein [Halomonas sp. ISL-60]|uniref:TIGR02444 family protein n=1 Tax=unclassified Halomonas TaxID=2609666 RepID=UPI0007D993BA|nr:MULTISPECIES: TIGR02444 family protein [unclassified Halomonas]MBT2771231.1 TIGR02444 family protein [Halomonas sp. ISL-60]MBT2786614.1 TIGR02444 family protein [Halomonas sp. ISL-106]MBT2797636.1 TIGR02444 family protein [Halomonas sp. ISL-104]MBT2802830.1 TIGR02444 family protein [Halomonas sp. ISL-56]OAL58983.1 TIGR02444 family protein [Halomonas sp. ALS9]
MRNSIALDSTRLQRLQQTPLWDFALALYAKPGVEAACLRLQEEAELDVCEVLFHCWLYSCGLEVIPTAVARQREQRRLWQSRVTGVLRGLRRDLKATAAESESIAALRETIKQAELMAERENLQRWQTWVWESPSDEQRVVNVVEMSLDAAKWLRKQLFSTQVDQLSGDALKAQNVCLDALHTLTCQLDPHRGAR